MFSAIYLYILSLQFWMGLDLVKCFGWNDEALDLSRL